MTISLKASNARNDLFSQGIVNTTIQVLISAILILFYMLDLSLRSAHEFVLKTRRSDSNINIAKLSRKTDKAINIR